MPPDDALLIELVRGGSEDAAAQLFERHWPLVWHWAFGVTGDRALAEQVAQEAIVRAFRSLDLGRRRRARAPAEAANRLSSSTTGSTPASRRSRRCLEIPVGTVVSRLSRARATLRRQLEDEHAR